MSKSQASLLISICFILILKQAECFSCSSVTNSTYCQAYGCTFSNGACTGTFSPTCPEYCYYVEANASVSPGTGTVAAPFANISDAFKKVNSVQTKSRTYYIIILPKTSNDTFNLTGIYTYTSITLNVYPYIAVSYPTINFGQVTITLNKVKTSFSLLKFSTLPWQSLLAKTIQLNVASSITMSNMIFKDFSNDPSTVFIDNYFSESVVLINITAHNAPALQISSSTNLVAMISNLTLKNTVFNQFFINCFTIQLAIDSSTFKNITQSNGAVGSGLISVALPTMYSAGFAFTNVVVSGFSGQFLSSTTEGGTALKKTCLLSNITFEDVDLQTQGFLFVFNGLSNVDILNTSFSRIQNVITLINSQDISNGTAIKDCIFTTISSSKMKTISQHLSFLQNILLGLCGTFYNTYVTISNVMFTSISNTCLSFSNLDFLLQGITIDYSESTLQLIPAWLDSDNMGPMVVAFEVSMGQIVSSAFRNSNFKGKSGAGLYVLAKLASSSIMVTGSIFEGLQAQNGSAIYSQANDFMLAIKDSTFLNNKAVQEGGAIYFNSGEWQKDITVTIKNSTFEGNSAGIQGGAISVRNIMLMLQGSTFSGNEALNGGAFFGDNDESFSFVLKNNKFASNTAHNAGGAIRIMCNDSAQIISANTFENNIAIASPQFKDFIDSNPASIRINIYKVLKYSYTSDVADIISFVGDLKTNNELELLATFKETTDYSIPQKTGNPFNVLIEIQVLDEDGNLFKAVNTDQLRVSFKESEDCFIRGTVDYSFYQGVIYIYKETKLYAPINSQRTLQFSLIDSKLPNLGGLVSLDARVGVNFVECEQGEIYQANPDTCNLCPAGSVSFNDPLVVGKCTVCLSGDYDCLGGNVVVVHKGFWRADSQSLDVSRCLVSSACLGGLYNGEYNAHGHCATGYQGRLCNDCNSGYARTEGGECTKCTGNAAPYVKFAFYTISQLIFITYTLRQLITQTTGFSTKTTTTDPLKSSKARSRAIVIRIFVNFMQVIGILYHLDLQWPTKFITGTNAVSQLVASDQQSFVADCLIELAQSRNHSPYFLKFLIMALRPSFLWAGVFAFQAKNIIMNLRSATFQGLSTHAVATFVLIGFLVQPGILQMALESFKCLPIATSDGERSFMFKDLEVQCGSHVYNSGMKTFVWPLSIIWAIILPLMLAASNIRPTARKNRSLLPQHALICLGYQPRYLFWEYWIYTRKVILITITTFSHLLDPEHRVWLVSSALIIMFFIQVAVNPYEEVVFNQLETISLLCLCLIVGSQEYLLPGSKVRSKAEIGFLVISSLAFAGFTLRCGWLIWKPTQSIAVSPKEQTSQISLINEVIDTPKILIKDGDTKLRHIEEVSHDHEEGSEGRTTFRKSNRVKKASNDFISPRLDDRSPISARECELFIDRKITSARELLSDRDVSTPH